MMNNTPANVKSRRYDLMIGALAALAGLALVIDLIDGQPTKTLSSAAILIGIIAWWRARRFQSVRWRTIAWAAFALAFGAFAYRFIRWQEWV